MEKVYLIQTMEHYGSDDGYSIMVDSDVYSNYEEAMLQLFATYNDFIADGWELDEETAIDEMDNGTLKRYDIFFTESNGEVKNMELTLMEKDVITKTNPIE